LNGKKRKVKEYSADVETALYEITELSIFSDSMDDYYAKIHAIIGRLTYAANFFIALYDQNQGRVEFVYFVDEVDTELNVERLRVEPQADLRKSATGHLLRTGKMLHMGLEDVMVLQEEGILSSHGTEATDWLGVPLKYKDELLGAMVIQSYNPDIVYGKKEEDILQFVARQIALLIKSKLAEQALVEANRTLENRVAERTESLKQINSAMVQEIEERKKSEWIQAALFKITDLVSTTSSLDDFFQKSHQVISKLMYAENEYVALLTEDEKFIEFLYHVDQRDENPVKRPMTEESIKTGLTERILSSGEIILFNEKDESNDIFTGTICASYLGVPLKDKDKIFGVLAVQSYRKDIIYKESDKNVLMTIGQQIAIAILRKKDADSIKAAHEHLERRVKERTSELEKTIVKRRKIEQQLEYDSLHDALTGLPNRLYFSNHLNDKIDMDKKEKQKHFAVLFLDLDRFKLINDSLGHHVGDLFLIEISRRLVNCLRQNDVVARLGGDEFCILMRQIDNQKSAVNLATRILTELKRRVLVGKHSLITSASIGIRLVLDDGSSATEIMSDADAAMYQAKHQGKNCFCLFDLDIKNIVTKRMEIENDLRQAITNKDLYLAFQPVVELENNRVIGCEALIRWQHLTKGFIPPDVFIPIAEETGVIIELGEFVAEQAALALKTFSKNPLTEHLFVNINVSAIQILSRTFDDFIRKLIISASIKPSLLNVEITESILIEDYKAATNFVRELKSMGINIYLDDFGTGFSSLSYLHQFPFDVIKLDKSFIDAMEISEKNIAIVESIASMANNLKMKIVAEGIETEEQLNKLNKFDYHYGQGYFFAKPMPLESMIEFVVKKQLGD